MNLETEELKSDYFHHDNAFFSVLGAVVLYHCCCSDGCDGGDHGDVDHQLSKKKKKTITYEVAVLLMKKTKCNDGGDDAWMISCIRIVIECLW